MRSFLSIVYVCIFCIIYSCSSEPTKGENGEKDGKHHMENHSKANQHMHGKWSIAELIDRFDDPERNKWQKPMEVLSEMGDLSDKTVLDIGAGSGYFSFPLSAKAKKVIAADVEKEFLDHIQGRIESDGISNMDTLLIPYSGPDSLQDEVDLALIVNTYHHIDHRIRYFKNLKSHLSSGASLYVVDFRKNLPKDAPGPPERMRLAYEEVRRELQKAGYVDFSVELELLPYQYILKAKVE